MAQAATLKNMIVVANPADSFRQVGSDQWDVRRCLECLTSKAFPSPANDIVTGPEKTTFSYCKQRAGMKTSRNTQKEATESPSTVDAPR